MKMVLKGKFHIFFNCHLTESINKALFHICRFRMFAITYAGVFIRTTVS